MKSLKQFYLISIIFSFCFFPLLYICFPDLRLSLAQEDQFIENSTAIFYFISFFCGIFFTLTIKPLSRWYQILPWVSLICFLDEVGFGERMFGFKNYIMGYHVDGLHDILGFAKNLVKRFLVFQKEQLLGIQYNLLVGLLSILFLGFIGYIGLFVFKNRRRYIKATKNFIEAHPPYFFFLCAVGFGIVSVFFDELLLRLFKTWQFGSFLEELNEMNGALSFIFATFAIKSHSKSREKKGKRESAGEPISVSSSSNY